MNEALHTILAPEYVLSGPETCAAYAVQGITPGYVAAPGTIQELARLLHIAAAHNASVIPWGGGTQQSIGAPPASVDLVVRTSRLDRVLIHEPDDLTISVEAGMTIGALREYLARHGQMLPVDPALPGKATIGGLIATAADGPRRLGYGTLRDLMIGIAVIEADGRISKAGGMVVKNVSGFDMMKLYLGSFGTLAVIASANFKLQPIPRAAATLICSFPDRQAAFGMIDALHDSQLTPTATEFLSGSAPGLLGLAGACVLAVRTEGPPAAVERHLTDMHALAQRNRASGSEQIDGPAEQELWARIADLPQTETVAPDEAVVKYTVLPAETEQMIGVIEEQARVHGAEITSSARALNGVIYTRLRPLSATALQQIVTALPQTQWVATSIPGTPRWGPPPSGFDLMRQIKHEFDPARRLNPGRFIIQ